MSLYLLYSILGSLWRSQEDARVISRAKACTRAREELHMVLHIHRFST